MKVITRNQGQVRQGESKAGIVMHNFLVSFDDTFNKSSHLLFSEFFKKNEKISKWMIFSDYVINSKEKPNDVITFSILPHAIEFKKLESLLKDLSPKDIKKSAKVNRDFINFINGSQILNISIILDKNIVLDPFNERESLKTCYKTALNQVDYWIKNEGKKENYIRLKKLYKILLNDVSRQGANLRNIRNIEIVSNLIAYITFQICISSKVDIIGWFSDRDSMLNHKVTQFSMPAIFDLAHNLFHNLMFLKKPEYTEEFIFGMPEQTGAMWYDSINRIPDLIAATLADYNLTEKTCSHEKFVPIVKEIITNEKKNLIYKISILNNGFQTSYLSFPYPIMVGVKTNAADNLE